MFVPDLLIHLNVRVIKHL